MILLQSQVATGIKVSFSANMLSSANNIWLGYRNLLPLNTCLSWLAEHELEYCKQASVKRALQFANGRALVRQILQQQGFVPIDIELALPNEQAPELRINGQRWQLSISHSGQAVAVAFSPAVQLGVDIEQLKVRDWSILAEPYPLLQGVSDLSEFYQCWTAAEAYCKATGSTIWQVLQQPLPQTPRYQHIALDGYALCLCSHNPHARIIVVHADS